MNICSKAPRLHTQHWTLDTLRPTLTECTCKATRHELSKQLQPCHLSGDPQVLTLATVVGFANDRQIAGSLPAGVVVGWLVGSLFGSNHLTPQGVLAEFTPIVGQAECSAVMGASALLIFCYLLYFNQLLNMYVYFIIFILII